MTPKILILKYQSGHGSSITPPSGDGLHQEFSSLLARHKAGRCNSVPYGSIKLILTIGMTLPSLNLIRQEPQVSDMLSLTLSLRSRLTFLDLLAVWPGSLQNFEVFSIACSFAEQVSGYDIIQAADAAGHCRHKTCQITYRWQEIPNTLRPTHDMGHGDGFQILIQQSVAPGKPILMNHWVQERLNVPGTNYRASFLTHLLKEPEKHHDGHWSCRRSLMKWHSYAMQRLDQSWMSTFRIFTTYISQNALRHV